MKNFRITAKETIYYTEFVQCESEEQLKKLLQTGDIIFEHQEITDNNDFEICEIEEMSVLNS